MDAESGLVCGVCNKLMRNPQILPCNHSFCKNPCLLKHPNSTWASCIYCFIEVPASQLQPNYKLAARIREVQRARSRFEFCPLCRKAVEQQVQCEHCMLQVCFTCRNQHMTVVRNLDPCPSCRNFVQSRTQCLHCDQRICNLCVQKHIENLSVIVANKIESINRKRDQFKALKEDLISKKADAMKKIGELNEALEGASDELNSACARSLSATKDALGNMASKLDDQLTSTGQQYAAIGSSMKGLEERGSELNDSKDLSELLDFKNAAQSVIKQVNDKTNIIDRSVEHFEKLSVSRCFTTISSKLEDFSLLAVKGLPVTGDGRHPMANKRFFSQRELKGMRQHNPSIAPQELPAISTVKIYVGDLPQNVTANDLLEYFKQFGTVEDPYVAKDFKTHKSLNYGFVTFSDPEAVEKVLNSAPHFLKDSKIHVRRFKVPPHDEKLGVPSPCEEVVEVPNIRRVFVGGLGDEIGKSDLITYCTPFGPVRRADIVLSRATDRSRGFAYVTFETGPVRRKVLIEEAETAQVVLRKQPHFIAGRRIKIRPAVPSANRERAHSPLLRMHSVTSCPQLPNESFDDILSSLPDDTASERDSTEGDALRIFVGNLSQNITKKALATYFAAFGEITHAELIYSHDTGQFRGFGFVTFASKDSVKKVLSTEPHFIGTCRANICIAYSRQEVARYQGTRRDASRLKSTESKPKPSLKEVQKEAEGFAFFVGDLNVNMTEDVITDYFSAFGDVTKVIINSSKEVGTNRKHAFVFFENEESVKKVFDAQPHSICGSVVCVKPDTRKKKDKNLVPQPASPALSVESKPKSSSKEVEKHPEGFAFFVGNLNMTIKEEVLSVYFSTFGIVKKVLIFPTKGPGMQRKYAFVFMESEESVKKVFDSQPHIICGSEVCVKPDKRKKKANKRVPLPGSPVSSKAVDGTKAASQRCPEWPQCKDLQCAYIHPTAICADTPCLKGATCPFLHPEDAEKLMSHDSVMKKEEEDFLKILLT